MADILAFNVGAIGSIIIIMSYVFDYNRISSYQIETNEERVKQLLGELDLNP